MVQTQKFYPDGLKRLPVWLLWRLERRDGRETKVPYSARYDGHARSDRPDTWASYEDASEKFARGGYNGLAVAISPKYRMVFVDLDHCVSDGELSDRAARVLARFPGTYAEISQSGHGLHILCYGEIERSFKSSSTGVEMYDHGRFCSLTWNAVQPCELREEQRGLDETFREFATRPRALDAPIVRGKPTLADADIIERACRDSKFAEIYAGYWQRYFGSQSEADLYLCAALAFWCERDPESIDRLFRTSGLVRDKWGRADYRRRTIAEAVAGCRETLSEYKERKKEERVNAFKKAFIAEQ